MCQVNSISCNAVKRKLQRNLFTVAVCLCWLVLGNVRIVGKFMNLLLSFHFSILTIQKWPVIQ